MRLKSFVTLCFKTRYKNYSNFSCHQPVSISISRTFSQWDIVGSVCLERKPVISQSLSPLEQKYLKYLQKLEAENSFLSEHEKRHIEDKRLAEKLIAGLLEDSDAISKQTAQDFEDSCTEEFYKFKPSSRLTDADDKHSAQRKMHSSLVFVIKQKIGNDFKWVLPQAIHEEGETLRQTAERALNQAASCHCTVHFMGNAPVGYYKYKYPKAVRRNGICGAKVFFFKAQLLGAKERALSLKESDSATDYLWLTHSELEDSLQPVLCRAVNLFLYPDVLNLEDRDGVQETDEEEPMASSLRI